MDEKIGCKVTHEAGYEPPHATVKIVHHHRIVYVDPDPDKSWIEEVDNIVPTVCLNKMLDDTMGSGTRHPNFYMGIVDGSPTYQAADTMASHSLWNENTACYSNSTRPVWTPNGAASGGSMSNSSSAGANAFAITGSATIAGSFLVSSSDTAGATKGGTGGTLRSAANFSSPKTVSAGGTLTSTITATLTSA